MNKKEIIYLGKGVGLSDANHKPKSANSNGYTSVIVSLAEVWFFLYAATSVGVVVWLVCGF
jgi:hypothetical protein